MKAVAKPFVRHTIAGALITLLALAWGCVTQPDSTPSSSSARDEASAAGGGAPAAATSTSKADPEVTASTASPELDSAAFDSPDKPDDYWHAEVSPDKVRKIERMEENLRPLRSVPTSTRTAAEGGPTERTRAFHD